MGRSSSSARKSQPASNPNLGSKVRNKANQTSVKKQLNDPRISKINKGHIAEAARAGFTRPFPIKNAAKQAAWQEDRRTYMAAVRMASNRRDSLKGQVILPKGFKVD